MAARHSPLVYLKSAFLTYPNYVLLLAASLAALATQNPGWLAIGAGLELPYLYFLSTSPRFRRLVDSQLGESAQLDIAALKARLLPGLEPGLRERFLRLEQLTAPLLGAAGPRELRRDPYFKDNQQRMASLLVSFMRIAEALTRYGQYLDGDAAQRVAQDIRRLEEEVLTSDERVQEVKLKNIEVLERRLQKLEKASANREYLTAQLKTVEDTLQLVADQAVTLSDPRGTGLQVDTLLQNLQDSEQLAEEMDALLDLDIGLDDELDAPLPQRSRQRQ